MEFDCCCVVVEAASPRGAGHAAQGGVQARGDVAGAQTQTEAGGDEDSTILLKGARPFQLERLIPLFNRRLNATRFQIDLQALRNNLMS